VVVGFVDIPPVVSALELTWYITNIYGGNLHFSNNVIIIKTKNHSPQT
jgi:hypothetical protein